MTIKPANINENRNSLIKKYFLFFILFIGLSVQIFASNEFLGSIGFSYGTVFEKSINSDTASFMGSPGIALNTARPFRGKNYYNQIFLGFPQSIHTSINGIETKVNLESGIQLGMIIGRAFFLPISEKLIFQPCVGLNATLTKVTYINDKLISSDSSSFGIGGNIGFVYIITGRFALNMGNFLSFDYSPSGLGGWARHFFQFTTRPYVSIAVFTY